MPKYRIYFSRLYTVDIEAEDDIEAENMFTGGNYKQYEEIYHDTEITDIEE